MGGRGNTGNRAGASTEQSQLNREFKPKDLKNSARDQYGDYRYSETTLEYGKELIKTLRPGDVVNITRTNKDGTVLKTSVEVMTPTDMDKEIAKSGRSFEPTAQRYAEELKQGTVVFGKRTGQSLDRMMDSTPDGKVTFYYGFDFTDMISKARSKVKSVLVEVKRRR